MIRIASVALAVACAFASAASAEPPPSTLSHVEKTDRSHDLFESGLAHYNLGEYQQAIDAFKEGYRLVPLPLFLFNIAQSYRRLGEPAKAMEFYQTFLKVDPQSPIRASARQYLVELKAQLNPPPPRIETPIQPPVPAIVVAATEPPPRKRRWLWPVLGTGLALVAAGGIALAIVFAPHGPPSTDFGNFPVALKP
jgi:tetratricopeptide (TPR) repeat protein